MKTDRGEIEKLENFKEKLPDGLVEFRMWLDQLYKKADEKMMGDEEVKEKVSKGIWKNGIDNLHGELGKLEELKKKT